MALQTRLSCGKTLVACARCLPQLLSLSGLQLQETQVIFLWILASYLGRNSGAARSELCALSGLSGPVTRSQALCSELAFLPMSPLLAYSCTCVIGIILQESSMELYESLMCRVPKGDNHLYL